MDGHGARKASKEMFDTLERFFFKRSQRRVGDSSRPPAFLLVNWFVNVLFPIFWMFGRWLEAATAGGG